MDQHWEKCAVRLGGAFFGCARYGAFSTVNTNFIEGVTTSSATKYASCFSCHSATNILSDDNNSFKEHKKHIQGEDAACNVCHDPHASDNDRLINFDTSVVTPFLTFFQSTDK